MPTEISSSAVLRPTQHAKKMIERAMYVKGLNFLGAALLLKKTGGYSSVVLHLLCQGVEITLKALLLAIDYDEYQPKLVKPYGHNLVCVATAATDAVGLSNLRPELRTELGVLNKVYSRHRLRYGTSYDVLVDIGTIPCERVFRRIAAVVRLVNRTGVINEPGI